jgi:hypothetical protein
MQYRRDRVHRGQAVNHSQCILIYTSLEDSARATDAQGDDRCGRKVCVCACVCVGGRRGKQQLQT